MLKRNQEICLKLFTYLLFFFLIHQSSQVFYVVFGRFERDLEVYFGPCQISVMELFEVIVND